MPDRHAENPPPRALGQLKQLMRELLPRQSRKSWIKVGPRLAPIRQGRGVGFDPDSLSLSAREWLELPVYVRALRRVPAVWRRAFDDLHFELNRQFLRRIASGVIAGLILQFSVQHVLARHNTCKRAHNYAYRELCAVNAQLLIRSKRKTGLLARRVGDFSDHNIRWRVDFERRGNKKFGVRFVGVDVKAGADVKAEADIGRLAAGYGGDRRG